MPSTQSQIIYDTYKGISDAQAKNPEMGVDEVRARFEALQHCSTEPTDVTYENVDANGVPCLWIKPINAPKDRVILYSHGGGYVVMGPAIHRKFVAHLAKASNATALIPDYRLAPEHQWPAMLDDCVTAYRWLIEKQGIKPGSLGSAGDSAGGSLAVAVPLKAKKDGLPLPAAIFSSSPWTDQEFKGQSFESNAKTDVLVQKGIVQFMAQTAGIDKNPKDPFANVLYNDLAGLPPLYINVGGAETLLDDSRSLAELAKKAGVDVVLDESEGMQHVHIFMAGRAKEADDVINTVGKFFQKHWAA